MDEICSICFLDKECVEKTKKCTLCTFIYHQKCLESWYKESRKQECPICATVILKPSLYLVLSSNLKRLNVLQERALVFVILYLMYLFSGKTVFLLLNIILERYFNTIFQQILQEDTLKLIYLFVTTPILEKVYDNLILKRLLYHQVEILDRMDDIDDFRNLFLVCHRLCHKVVGFCLIYNFAAFVLIFII